MRNAPLIEPISNDRLDRSFAVVTKTYAPDLTRCELLAESLDRCAPMIPHYLIVDRRDRPAFKHLEYGKRQLIDSEDLLNVRMLRTPGSKAYWLSLRALPVRGWIMQQIIKIAAIDAIPEQTLVLCDSDVAFIRCFDRNDLLVDGKVGLFDVEHSGPESRAWTDTARRLLGLPTTQAGYRNYVGHLICWNRETVKAMQERIESSTGINWQLALARTLNFSEYMIYGTFVREVLGYKSVDHSPSTVPLVPGLWGARTDKQIDDFFVEFDHRTIAIMIHSKDGIDPARYRGHLKRFWKRL